MITRRELQFGAAGWLAVGAVEPTPVEPAVSLVLPSVTSQEIGLKVWMAQPQTVAPILTVSGRRARVQALDSNGLVWGFQASGLTPETAYDLRLRDGSGRDLREPWILRTFPNARSTPSSMRVLVFSCAGGDDRQVGRPGQTVFLDVVARRALLDRGLSFTPDLVIANGDHVYWDQASLLQRSNPLVASVVGDFYRSVAVLDDRLPAGAVENEAALATILHRQIAAVYGQRLASTPTVFVADDHDYFENDLAGDWGATLPPTPFLAALQRRTSDLAYPYALDRRNVAETDQTVQCVSFGRLVEFVLYDCRRNLSRAAGSGFLSPRAEQRVIERTVRSRARQLIHVPSTPFGWTAGKWAEWYEDRGSGAGAYGDDKAFWNPGWFQQHQRLLTALSGQRDRRAIAVSGDLHASAATEIRRSGTLDFSANPVVSLLAGPLGSGDNGFPSSARGEAPSTPDALDTRALAALEERNGFTLLDITDRTVTARLFSWRPPQAIDAIASLEPRETLVIAR